MVTLHHGLLSGIRLSLQYISTMSCLLLTKFNYLNSLLEHSAAEAIAGLSLTSTNYDEAIAVLKKRFGNKQTNFQTHDFLIASTY